MKKIPCLFKRDYECDNKLVYDEVNEGCEWVLAGEGIATRKFDGTCCLIKDGKYYKRYTLKRGKKAPKDFIAVTEVDPDTGKQFGWVPLGPYDHYHMEALMYHRMMNEFLPDGTYELCGPKVNSNNERFSTHSMVKHGEVVLLNVPHNFSGLRDYLCDKDIEGIVFHHRDGRMAKIRKCDFGFKRSCDLTQSLEQKQVKRLCKGCIDGL